MSVKRLFWEDPYLTAVQATVTSVAGPEVTVDRTVAFAASGGQRSDVGTIGGHEILLAEVRGPEIVYALPADHGLSPGDRVEVRIDWHIRYSVMRLHFATELVLELVNRLFDGPERLGAHITERKGRIDFRWERGSISETFPVVQAELRRLVAADLPIECAFSDEATGRRFWRVAGFAQVPCSGTHPRRTGEVGEMRLKRENPGAGVERIEIRPVD